jgi:galactose oxidase
VTATYPNRVGNRSSGGEKGSSVILPLRPPGYEPRVVVLGGDLPGAADSVEIIDLSVGAPAWRDLPNLQIARSDQVNSVLLPDGRVLVVGGAMGAGDGAQIEFLDSKDVDAGWVLGPAMQHFRGYHSAAILLVDGSVLVGGDPNPQVFERYYPGYCFQPRPTITMAPAGVAHGAAFRVDSPEASVVVEVMVVAPGAVTHGFNQTQRAIECSIVGGDATGLDIVAPPSASIAPPGYYLLFLVDANRVPSIGRWIQLT